MDNHVFSLVLQGNSTCYFQWTTKTPGPFTPSRCQNSCREMQHARKYYSSIQSTNSLLPKMSLCNCLQMIYLCLQFYCVNMVIFQFAGFRENVRRKKKPRKNYHEISPKYKAIFHNLVDGPMISQHVHQDFTKISWPSIYDVH